MTRTNSVPLDLRTENGFTVAQEQEMLRNVAEAERDGKWYTDVDKMMDEI